MPNVFDELPELALTSKEGSVMNSLFLNSNSLGCLDKVYSDSGERGTKARDDQGG